MHKDVLKYDGRREEPPYSGTAEETRTFTADELKAYSDAIAQAEREACAKIAENLRIIEPGHDRLARDGHWIADTIRARAK